MREVLCSTAVAACVHAQAECYWNQWPSRAEFETWDSSAETGKGSYDLYRVGLSYFIKGHGANIKAGYEHLKADAPLQASSEDTIDTFALGLYLQY